MPRLMIQNGPTWRKRILHAGVKDESGFTFCLNIQSERDILLFFAFSGLVVRVESAGHFQGWRPETLAAGASGRAPALLVCLSVSRTSSQR